MIGWLLRLVPPSRSAQTGFANSRLLANISDSRAMMSLSCDLSGTTQSFRLWLPCGLPDGPAGAERRRPATILAKGFVPPRRRCRPPPHVFSGTSHSARCDDFITTAKGLNSPPRRYLVLTKVASLLRGTPWWSNQLASSEKRLLEIFILKDIRQWGTVEAKSQVTSFDCTTIKIKIHVASHFCEF